jgi:AcrR family transcriptional regulator
VFNYASKLPVMGRRSDHSRSELKELIIAEGHTLMAETGFARFSAREVARRIGYSVGTIYNLFDSLDHLLVAINTRTFILWTEFVRRRLESADSDRMRALVEAYFSFARENPNLWMAIYDHRLPPGMPLPDEDAQHRAILTGIVVQEVADVVRDQPHGDIQHLARSLIATVHGHCTFDLNGTFSLMGVTDAVEMALERVRQSLAAQGN